MYVLPGVLVESMREDGSRLIIEAVAAAATGTCPTCGQESARRHSEYSRHLNDLPSCGRPVQVRLTVRRFRCANAACVRRTFVEQVAGATRPHGRQIVRLEGVLRAFSAALGGEAGARLAGRIGVTIGGDALLRSLRRGGPVAVHSPRVLGVDDWAWRRGQRYGSVLVDLEARRPIDLLADRTATSLEAWLTAHPGVKVVVRDRSTEYARGATRGAPDAVQVLDRWHVLRNVREVAQRLVERSAQDLRRLDGAAAGPPRRRRSAAEEASREAVRRRAAERHAAIKRLAAAGGTILGIARQLRTSRTTVRRYLFADAAPERDYAPRPSMLDPYEPYLRRRWAEGCRNGLLLWRELKEQGYPGASRAVSRWAELRREVDPTRPRLGRPRAMPEPAGPEPTAPPRRPSPARLAWLLVRDPGSLNDEDLGLLTRLQTICPPAATAYPLLQEIARLIKERAPERLDGWLERAADCGVPDLVTFAEGLRREQAELLAALELPWSTGPVEGQITRLKLLKRQGYGRCSLDTLKRRLVHAA